MCKHSSVFARTDAYDRPDLASLILPLRPQNYQEMAADLHSLLHTAKVRPAYALVGHSLRRNAENAGCGKGRTGAYQEEW